MARRTPTRKQRPASRPTAVASPAQRSRSAISPPGDDSPVAFSDLTLHELFQQQTRALLDRSDLDEEQKQGILIAMSCPCCGAGGMSYTVKLKPR
jgi:hypothetical protein